MQLNKKKCGFFREFANNDGTSYKIKATLREMAAISL